MPSNAELDYRRAGLLNRAHYPATISEALDTIDRYVVDRIPPGGFTRAVLENNLVEAVVRADSNNLRHIKAIALYVYNETPGGQDGCWGSAAKVAKWLDGGET